MCLCVSFIVSFYPGFCLISYQHILTSSSREVKVIKMKSTWGHYLNKFIVSLISMISTYLRVRAGAGIRDKHRRGKKWFLHAFIVELYYVDTACVWFHNFFEHKPIMLLKCSHLQPFVNNRYPLFGLWSYLKGFQRNTLKALKWFYLWHACNVTLHTPCTCMTTHETHARCKKRQYLRDIPVRQLLMHVLIIFFVLTCFNILFLY